MGETPSVYAEGKNDKRMKNPYESECVEGIMMTEIEYIKGEFTEVERSQCEFINTIGMRCPEKYWGIESCCGRHRCSYMVSRTEQCSNVINCNNRWYCDVHREMCRCHFTNNKIRCQNVIYFHSYVFGCDYCDEHHCSVPNCRFCVDNNKYKLCLLHFKALIFCDYYDNENQKCQEIIKRPNIIYDFNNYDDSLENYEFEAQLMEIEFACQSLHNGKFCEKHRCRIPNCKKRIVNDKILYCKRHTIECDYIFEDGTPCKNLVRYSNEDAKRNSESVFWGDGNVEKFYCDEHRCHWNGSLLEDETMCNKQIEIKPDCHLYCDRHYNIVMFSKYEYAT